MNAAAAVLGCWGRLCQQLDDALNPVAVRDYGILLRKRQVGVSLLTVHVCAIAALIANFVVGDEFGVFGSRFGLIHLLAGGLMLLVLPAQAGLALREPRATVELVLVAGITARRLAFGRVLAVYLPGLVVLISLAPYFLLNYFLGNARPVADLCFLSACAAASAVLTAAGAAVGTLRYVSTLAGVALAGCCLAIFAQLGFGDFDDGLLKFFGLELPVFVILSVMPASWFFLLLAAARFDPRSGRIEDSIAFGMAAILGSGFALMAGAASLGAGPVMAAVVAVMACTGIAALAETVLGGKDG